MLTQQTRTRGLTSGDSIDLCTWAVIELFRPSLIFCFALSNYSSCPGGARSCDRSCLPLLQHVSTFFSPINFGLEAPYWLCFARIIIFLRSSIYLVRSAQHVDHPYCPLPIQIRCRCRYRLRGMSTSIMMHRRRSFISTLFLNAILTPIQGLSAYACPQRQLSPPVITEALYKSLVGREG